MIVTFPVSLPIAAGFVAGSHFPPIVVPLFGLLLVMVSAWLILCSWLFHRLRARHPSTYESMGSPTLFWNNSVRNNWLFGRFLFTSQWRELDDPAVSRMVPLMRFLLVVYLVLFLACMVLFFLG
jgi:hypothetical protein